jgi:hypothetical protein
MAGPTSVVQVRPDPIRAVELNGGHVYTGLEPVTIGLNTANVTLDYSAYSPISLTISAAGTDNQTFIDSGSTEDITITTRRPAHDHHECRNGAITLNALDPDLRPDHKRRRGKR